MALYRAIMVFCLHGVSTIVIGVEGANQGEEEPSHHHVAPGMSLPHEPSRLDLYMYLTVQHLTHAQQPYNTTDTRV
jgi:hypothetical protein